MSGRLSKLALQGVVLIAVVAGAFYFAQLAHQSEAVRAVVSSYGYVGIFIVALISGFNILVPVPAPSFLPLFIESGLEFWQSVLVIAAGMTLADMIVFGLGRFGRLMVPASFGEKVLSFFKIGGALHGTMPILFLFIFASIAPLPNEVLLVPFAFLGYRLIQVLPAVALGNFLFSLLYANGILLLFRAF